MKQSYESKTQRVAFFARRIFSLTLLLFCIYGAIATTAELLELEWKWLETMSVFMLIIFFVLLIICGITPGILIIARVPWLAYACLRVNPAIGNMPWEQLSGFRKFLVYFWSILSLSFTLLALVTFIKYTIQ